jgi:hypothetical protein
MWRIYKPGEDKPVAWDDNCRTLMVSGYDINMASQNLIKEFHTFSDVPIANIRGVFRGEAKLEVEGSRFTKIANWFSRPIIPLIFLVQIDGKEYACDVKCTYRGNMITPYSVTYLSIPHPYYLIKNENQAANDVLTRK